MEMVVCLGNLIEMLWLEASQGYNHNLTGGESGGCGAVTGGGADGGGASGGCGGLDGGGTLAGGGADGGGDSDGLDGGGTVAGGGDVTAGGELGDGIYG
ncbi:hypothetical protein CTI12_AA163830 [Artemisia annua]|uniref:Uncharacterized protein n=1 Tax=Artemisia annua TaxID=35608 RepID=A0A2U1PDS9_ARTAN|nr:hypothetical protein CTI12_AA163830 [Artemisia annua]